MSAVLILQLLPVLISSVTNMTELIQKITTDLKQNAELNPEQEAELDAHIAELEAQPWWKVQD